LRFRNWQPPTEEESNEIFTDVLPMFATIKNFSPYWPALRCMRLPFYAEYRLCSLPDRERTRLLLGLWKDGDFKLLDDTNGPIYRANQQAPIQLSADNVCSYAIFFFDLVRGPHGYFTILESPDEVQWLPTASAADNAKLGAQIKPPTCNGVAEDGRYLVNARVLFKDALFETNIRIARDGTIELTDEDLLSDKLPIPAAEPVEAAMIEKRTYSTTDTGNQLSDDAAGEGGRGRGPKTGPLVAQLGNPDMKNTLPSDHQVMGASQDVSAAHDPYRLIASFLVGEAVEMFVTQNLNLFAKFQAGNAASGFDVFTQYLKVFLPTVAIATDYTDLAFKVAEVFARPLGVDLYDTSDSISQSGRIAGASPVRGPKIVLVEHGVVSASIASNNPNSVFLARDLAILARSPHVVLYVCDKLAKLPTIVENVVDIQLNLPSFDDGLLRRLLIKMYGAASGALPETSSWSRFVLPRDIARVARSPIDLSRAIDELRQIAEHRANRDAAVDAVPIEALHGLGEARDIAQDLIADIKGALAGHIKWSDVDRGMLLVGPPGTGKTTLARSISKSCGINFVLASAASWQAEGVSLGPHIQAIRETFRRARLLAPSIMFIDEIDSIGNRDTFSGQNGMYQTEVVNTLLEEMQGFRESDGVVVIAATNRLEAVDPALQRAGRLDRVINIPYPSIPALSEIYKFYLDRINAGGEATAPIDCNTLARLSYGRTGADVEFFLRGARRRARRDNSRPMTEADVVAEIMDSPRGRSGSTPISSEELRRTAVHEAGHALMAIAQADGENPIGYISIVPRGDGIGGFTSRLADTRMYRSFPDLCCDIRIALAGRAAEELVFGKEHISGGAGGSSSRSDLAAVSRRILDAFAREGFSQSAGLLWIGPDGGRGGSLPEGHPLTSALIDETRKLIDKLYNETQQTLTAQRAKLDRLAAILIDRQEITGPELKELLAR
jgi:SpoVK/Ycf46/Vps4 family AAA+-type ATPase